MFSRLASKLSRLFTSIVRGRGQTYYARGAVNIHHGSATKVEATVWGSEDYEVQIEWTNGDLALHCSCPYFASDGACKHLWATVLAAEASGYLSKVDLKRDVNDFGFEDPLEGFGALRGSPATREIPRRLALAPSPPSWKVQIEKIAGTDNKVVEYHSQWPSRRQVIYAVNFANSMAAGQVVLSLCARDRRADGEYGRAVALNLQRNKIPSLPLAEDREILSALAGGSQFFDYGSYNAEYNPIPGTIVLRYPLAATVMPLIARTGRCFLRNSAAPEDFTPLAWDEGGAGDSSWSFARAGKKRGSKQVTGRWPEFFAGARTKMDASVPTMVTPGGFVFARGMVAPLAPDARCDTGCCIFRKTGVIHAPAGRSRRIKLSTLLCTPGIPQAGSAGGTALRRGDARASTNLAGSPVQAVTISTPGSPQSLSFDYEGRLLPALDPTPGFYEFRQPPVSCVRDTAAEQAATSNLLNEVGVKFRPATYYQPEAEWDSGSLPSCLAWFAG